MKNQKNGNNQINEVKGAFNNKVANLKNLGSTRGVQWRGQLRNKSI
ncbi:hypothetical protein N9Q05_01990 [bacterium]|nr:hypothetical protein [bacterium]